MSTTTTSTAATTLQTSVRDAVRQVRDLCRDFVADVRRINRGPLMVGDSADSEGADFVFTLEVRPEEYQDVVQKTSALEADYYVNYGINFLVDVRAI